MKIRSVRIRTFSKKGVREEEGGFICHMMPSLSSPPYLLPPKFTPGVNLFESKTQQQTTTTGLKHNNNLF